MSPMWDVRELPNDLPDWGQLLPDFLSSPTGRQLTERLRLEASLHSIFPQPQNVLRALILTPLHQVRVVILGQDPYHGVGQADGLSFSVPRGVAPPPSLRNIFRELREDLGVTVPAGFELSHWAKQGVLLLNTTLTVRADSAGSHRGFGWEALTDAVIQRVNDLDHPVVFVLWGKDAQNKLSHVDRSKHLAICSPHPSPLSAHRGFFGSRPFSRTNQFMSDAGFNGVVWV